MTSWRSGTGSRGGGDEVAPADVDVVGEPDRHRLRRDRDLERPLPEVDAGHGRARAGRQHDDLVADPHRAGGELAGIPAVLHVLGGAGGALRADDDLHRHPEGLVHRVGVGRQGLEQLEQRGAVVPGRVRRAVDDVVADQGRHRDRRGRAGCRARPRWRARRRRPCGRRPRCASTRSILLTAMTTCGTRISAATARWRRVCSSTPLRASTSSTSASAVDEPVTVLRVYCTCPGQSASTNERWAVAK